MQWRPSRMLLLFQEMSTWIESSKGGPVVPNSTTDKAIRPAVSTRPIVSDTSFKMDDANSNGVKRPIQEEIGLEKNGNISTIKRKRRIPQPAKIKLFEILSMILQALANPQITESKEHEIYVVLQKAHTEIQRMQEIWTTHNWLKAFHLIKSMKVWNGVPSN